MFANKPTTIQAFLCDKVEYYRGSAPSPVYPAKQPSSSKSQLIFKEANSPSLYLHPHQTEVADLMSNEIFSATLRFDQKEYVALIDKLFADDSDLRAHCLSRLLGQMSKANLLPLFHEPDDGTEDVYRKFLEEFASVELALIVCKILESWIDVLATDASDATLDQARKAVIFLVNLYTIAQKQLPQQPGDGTSSVKPDILVRTEATENKNMRDICVIDAKTSAFAVYGYSGNNGRAGTKDGLMSTILQTYKGRSMKDIYNHHMNGWRKNTVELFGQMSTQAFRTDSKMCMFTSVYGFCRVGVGKTCDQASHFFVTENLMPPERTNDTPQRRSRIVNEEFACILFVFLSKALLSAEEDIFPPKERQMLQGVFDTPPVSIPYTILLWQYFVCAVFYTMSAAQLLLGYFAGIAKCFLTLKFVHVRFKNGRGVFQSIENGSWMILPLLEFEANKENDGHLIGFNPVAGLVLKAFSDKETCKKEADVYRVLSKFACAISPKFYDIYQNEETGFWGIVIDYAGEPLDNIEVDDLCQIENLVQQLHACGYHHHDLFEGNFLRGKDKKLRLIDFEFAARAEECLHSITREEELCPDEEWLRATKERLQSREASLQPS